MNRNNKIIKFKDLHIGTPDALIPKEAIDLSKFATNSFMGKVTPYSDIPSTRNVIYPLAQFRYDSEEEREKNIKKVCEYTEEYLNSIYEVTSQKRSDGFIFVKRQTSKGLRKGFLMCLDLKYFGEDFVLSQEPAIKEVEKNIKIREEAALEFSPTIMMVDDKDNSLFEVPEELFTDKLYDFDLDNGQNISAHILRGESVYFVTEKYEKIMENSKMVCIAGANYIMAAKIYYDHLVEQFGENFLRDHPLRYFMVEVVNMHDATLEFPNANIRVRDIGLEDFKKALEGVAKFSEEGNLKLIDTGDMNIAMEVSDFKKFKEALASINVLYDLGDKAFENEMMILMPKYSKEEVFNEAVNNNILPKGTFAFALMDDYRYFFEGRRIKM